MRRGEHWPNGRAASGFSCVSPRPRRRTVIPLHPFILDATTRKYVVARGQTPLVAARQGCRGDFRLTFASFSSINRAAAFAARRGDLGQLAPRKNLLKS